MIHIHSSSTSPANVCHSDGHCNKSIMKEMNRVCRIFQDIIQSEPLKSNRMYLTRMCKDTVNMYALDRNELMYFVEIIGWIIGWTVPYIVSYILVWNQCEIKC